MVSKEVVLWVDIRASVEVETSVDVETPIDDGMSVEDETSVEEVTMSVEDNSLMEVVIVSVVVLESPSVVISIRRTVVKLLEKVGASLTTLSEEPFETLAAVESEAVGLEVGI